MKSNKIIRNEIKWTVIYTLFCSLKFQCKLYFVLWNFTANKIKFTKISQLNFSKHEISRTKVHYRPLQDDIDAVDVFHFEPQMWKIAATTKIANFLLNVRELPTIVSLMMADYVVGDDMMKVKTEGRKCHQADWMSRSSHCCFPAMVQTHFMFIWNH